MRSGMRLVIDLGAIQYVASPVLGTLINLRKKLGAVGGRLGLWHVHPYLMEVFWVTRLASVFDLEP
jgi:anti-anti-sigma factor